MGFMDRNRDGVVNLQDGNQMVNEGIRIFATNTAASGAGFVGGVMLGLKKG